MFLFSRVTYLMQLLYLGKLSRPKYEQKLNKIVKISQDDVILIKNTFMVILSSVWPYCMVIILSKQYDARRLLSELPDKSWKLGSIDSLLNRSHKTGTIVPQPGSGRPRLVPCAQSGQAKKHRSARSISHFLSSAYRIIIYRDFQPTCYKWCRAQLLSEANRISHLTHW